MSNQEQNLPPQNQAEQLANLLCDYIAFDARHLDNDTWTKRGMSFIKVFMPVMEALKQAGEVYLYPLCYSQYMPIKYLMDIAYVEKHNYGEAFDEIRQPLIQYIESLPGYDKNNRNSPSDKLIEQHGFVCMPLSRAMGELVTFGTSNRKEDFIGMTLLDLIIAYNESLADKENKDSYVFLQVDEADNSVFGKPLDLGDENQVFSDKKESIFSIPDEVNETEIFDFFAKSQDTENQIFHVNLNKAS